MNPVYYLRKARLWISMLFVANLIMVVVVATTPAMSPSPDKNNKHDSVSVQVLFGEHDREVIHAYCSQPNAGLPPGLAKRGGKLPPGLEKHLRRNGQLPPGLQKKVQPFPVELDRRLPPLPPNYVRVFLSGRGLIVDSRFNILDVIEIFH